MSQPSAETRAELNLLLLLTALFASLTGIGSGERGLRPVQGVAVIQAAAQSQAAVKRAQRAIPAVAMPRNVRADLVAWPVLAVIGLPSAYLPFERRLE